LSEEQAASRGMKEPRGAEEIRPPAGRGPAAGEGPTWDWNRLLTPRVVLLMLPVAGFLVAAYWRPIVQWEVQWRDPAWGHGYLIPVIAVILAHFRLKELKPKRIETCIWGLLLIAAGALLRIWSETLQFGYPGQVTFLLVTAGVLLYLLGWQMLKALWVPVLYLGLMIPWNFKYYEGVALPLQNLAAAATARILGLIGYERSLGEMPLMMPVNAYRYMLQYGKVFSLKGNAVYLLSGPLTVAEVCSGLHLLFAFVALGVMMAFLYRRSTWERILIMASSVPIAVFCNVIRVTLMALSVDHLYFEEGRLALGAPSWSAYAPRIVSWPMTAWVGLGLAGAAVFLLATHGGTAALEKMFSRARLAGILAVGAAVTAVSARFAIGYPAPGDLEAVRQTVLNPQSAPHQAFGFAMLGLAFVLMWAELKVIDWFFIEEDPAEGRAPPAGAPR
jgi:exosortase/archaeosortase family protein